MWNILFKRIKMNLFTKQNQTYRCEKQAYVYQGEMAGGINQELRMNMHTLLYTRWITRTYYKAQGTLLNTV